MTTATTNTTGGRSMDTSSFTFLSSEDAAKNIPIQALSLPH